MTLENLVTSGDFKNTADTGLIMSSTRWLVDHYKAKEKYRLQMVEDLGLQPGNCVLDVGSGPGLWSNELAKKVVPNGKIIGIDLSVDALNYAKSNLENYPHQDIIEYAQADFFNMPYPDETFDFVFCANSQMYFTDVQKEQLLKEQKRVVKTGGRIASKEYDGETIILYPIPPELWLKMKNAVGQVLVERAEKDYYDEYVARKGRTLFFNLGLKDIATIPYPVQMFAPLSSHQKNYITEESQWFIKTASPYLSKSEIQQLESYFDPNSSEYILDKEDFSYLMVEFMSIGTKVA
ncbi:MAG: methyltransferase domain-containing protein [Nostocales cyanobacterium ELA583]|jgi:ubiquinone/menaquinone biosynthesis C-methylase UbiE